jgi:hypothetical protein
VMALISGFAARDCFVPLFNSMIAPPECRS